MNAAHSAAVLLERLGDTHVIGQRLAAEDTERLDFAGAVKGKGDESRRTPPMWGTYSLSLYSLAMTLAIVARQCMLQHHYQGHVLGW